MATSKWTEFNGTLLMVFAQQPTAQDWDEQMGFARALGQQMQRCLIFSDINLSSQQRREIAELTKKARTQVAIVVTNSAVTRMIVTGIGWFTGVHQAFDLRDAHAAFDALGVPTADLQILLSTAHRFADELGLDTLALQIAAHRAMPARAG